MTDPIQGVLFDKDGTLFDFAATWSAWAIDVIHTLSAGDPDLRDRLADAVGFDLGAGVFLPHSRVIAGTNREAAECLASALPGRDVDQLERDLAISAAQAPLAEAVPLVPLLSELSARDLALGVMTNDSESVAHTHLGYVGVAGIFDFIAGFDSGFGAKPDPAPLLAFAHRVQIDPGRIVMVGDSLHDLIAGQAAGMRCVGVLTGVATREDLAGHADIVLPDIGFLPDWIDRQAR
ncbi:MAG: HAD family hydrolase [Pelagimonas sp.]|jgi:phosphoglycolate phosphatase|nr:HAD family hydrolase [Pelagimonas sp.]